MYIRIVNLKFASEIEADAMHAYAEHELINKLPKTFQSPTMGPFCKDDEKYKVIEEIILKINKLKDSNKKIDGLKIQDILTVNGIRFTLEDGSWGLVRASSKERVSYIFASVCFNGSLS